MVRLRQQRTRIFETGRRAVTAALALTVALTTLVVVTSQSAQAQTLNVLHSFTDSGGDGYAPFANLAADKAGNLYGTTADGGNSSRGTVFRLKHQGSGWTFATLYDFLPQGDGGNPYAGVTIGPDGALYGTTYSGGYGGGEGTVFRLSPPAAFCRSVSCPWTETVLYAFGGGGNDGGNPYGGLVFDASGNLYGTTTVGGSFQNGTVYKLTRSNGGWVESILWNFGGGSDGAKPYSNLTFDQAGNLYGTTYFGGAAGKGTVFQLTPSGSGWSENPIYQFQGGADGYGPYTDVIFDGLGNLYGTTVYGGTYFGGTAFELKPSNGGWTHNILYDFDGGGVASPYGNLIIDSAGSLYGTTVEGGLYGGGSVFELIPSSGNWIESDLWSFTGSSGPASPFAGVILDQAGNLYGTTFAGGADKIGTVFEITR